MTLDVHMTLGLHANSPAFAMLLPCSRGKFPCVGRHCIGLSSFWLVLLDTPGRQKQIGGQVLSGRRALRVMTPSTKGLGGPT